MEEVDDNDKMKYLKYQTLKCSLQQGLEEKIK